MRAFVVCLLGVMATACAAGGGPSAPQVERPMASSRLEIVEGTPVTLDDGTVVEAKDIGYAHLADSRNLSMCTLVVRRGGEVVELPLAREHGGSDPESSGSALGWRFTLEVADPYRRPSRVAVGAQKL